MKQRRVRVILGEMVDVRTINGHIKKVYNDSEFELDSTIRKFRIVQTEGSSQVSREVAHYNLQMIIAVGFKVNNERLKNGGSVLTIEYFDRLPEQIQEIRLFERRFYQKITSRAVA